MKNRVSSRLLLNNRASSRLSAQNRVSQVFWDPVKNHVSPRSVLLKAVYLEALLYSERALEVLPWLITWLMYAVCAISALLLYMKEGKVLTWANTIPSCGEH